MKTDTTQNITLNLTHDEAQTLTDILCHITGNPTAPNCKTVNSIASALDNLGFQYNEYSFKGHLEAVCLVKGTDIWHKPGFYSANNNHFLSLNGILYLINDMKIIKPVLPITTCEYKQISFADL